MSSVTIESLLKSVQRPGRYVDGEWNAIRKDWSDVEATTVVVYPDLYEIGMSSPELQDIYHLLNADRRVLCERAFNPWSDMAAAMRQRGIPLYSLESRRSLRTFDFVLMVIGRELGYANVLESLDLAGIPVKASERQESDPLVLGLGARLKNPEPLAGVFDLFALGDPDAGIRDVLDLYLRVKGPAAGRPGRDEFLALAATTPGVYVPACFQTDYDAAGAVASVTPACRHVPGHVRLQVSPGLGPPLTSPVVPYLEVVDDRGFVEVQRDCGGSCRGCRAGSGCAVLRQRGVEAVVDAVDALVQRCGYREIGLLAPAGADYGLLMDIARAVRAKYPVGELSLVLPPLQLPHDGDPDQALASAEMAFSMGWSGVRYRWTLGRPGPGGDGVPGLMELVARTQEMGRRILGRKPKIRVEGSYHGPRPHTSTERSAVMLPVEELQRIHAGVRKELRKLGAHLSAPDPEAAVIEAALAMGDRRAGDVVHQAWTMGCTDDGRSRQLDAAGWTEAFQKAGLDADFYVRRPRSEAEVLPWSHIEPPDAGEAPTAERGARADECAAKPCPVCRYLDDGRLLGLASRKAVASRGDQSDESVRE
ncbi:MAG: hypothetical protein V3V35_08390 [Dehalococcoidia bacterium]